MNNRIAAITLVLIASLVGTTVLAESGGRHGKHDGNFRSSGQLTEKMAERLGLDESQRQAVENIRLATEPEIAALRERMEANRAAMKSLEDDDPNRSALLSDLATQNGQLATEATLLFDRVRTEFNAVLTEEQRAMVEEHRGKKGKRGGRENRGRKSQAT